MNLLAANRMSVVVPEGLAHFGQLHVLVPSPHRVTHFPGFQEQFEGHASWSGRDSIFKVRHSDLEHVAIFFLSHDGGFALIFSDPSIRILVCRRRSLRSSSTWESGPV